MTGRFLLLLAPALLAGCASAERSRFPSLALRPAESRGFEEPAAQPAAAVRPDPALDARIATTAAQADERARAFVATRSSAELKVAAAAGTAAGGDTWLDAQVALGELDVARAEAGEAVTTLEQLAADRAVAGEPPYPALEAALASARGRQTEVEGTIAALNARLSR